VSGNELEDLEDQNMEGNKARTENCGRDAKLKKRRKGERMKVEVSDGREWKEGRGGGGWGGVR
jgi:hypothetical protein